MIRDKKHYKEIVVDLTGPEGNAYNLLGMAARFCNQLGMTEQQKESVIEEMKSGDYENLIEVFDEHFGKFVILER